MTKRWSSTRSDLLKTKQQASKNARNAAQRELDIEDCDGDLAEIEGIAAAIAPAKRGDE